MGIKNISNVRLIKKNAANIKKTDKKVELKDYKYAYFNNLDIIGMNYIQPQGVFPEDKQLQEYYDKSQLIKLDEDVENYLLNIRLHNYEKENMVSNYMYLLNGEKKHILDNDYRLDYKTSGEWATVFEDLQKLGLIQEEKKRVRTWYTLSEKGKIFANAMTALHAIPFNYDDLPQKNIRPLREYEKSFIKFQDKTIMISKSYQNTIQFVEFEKDLSKKKKITAGKDSEPVKLLKEVFDSIKDKKLQEIKPKLYQYNHYSPKVHFSYIDDNNNAIIYEMSSKSYAYFIRNYGRDIKILTPEVDQSLFLETDPTPPKSHALIVKDGKTVGMVDLKYNSAMGKDILDTRSLPIKEIKENEMLKTLLSRKAPYYSLIHWQKRNKI